MFAVRRLGDRVAAIAEPSPFSGVSVQSVVVLLARLDAAWRVYERVYLPSRAVSTHRGYRSAVRRFLSQLPDPFTLADLMLWRGRMLESRRFSVSYVNQAIKVTRSITRRASYVTGDNELASLFAQLETLREPVRPPRCPPQDYVSRILGAARNPAEQAFMLLTTLGGLRRDEALGLMPEDWHDETSVLQAVRQRYRVCRKNGRPHSVTVNDPQLRRCIRWTIAHHAAIAPRNGKGAPETRRCAPYLFPWSHHYVEIMMTRVRRHLGNDAQRYVPRGTAWHAGRHWGTTELARKGVPLHDIQAWRGDADSAMTAGYVAMVRGATSGSVGILAGRARQHARHARPLCKSKVSRCPASTRDTGRDRHFAGRKPLSGSPSQRASPWKKPMTEKTTASPRESGKPFDAGGADGIADRDPGYVALPVGLWDRIKRALLTGSVITGASDDLTIDFEAGCADLCTAIERLPRSPIDPMLVELGRQFQEVAAAAQAEGTEGEAFLRRFLHKLVDAAWEAASETGYRLPKLPKVSIVGGGQ